MKNNFLKSILLISASILILNADFNVPPAFAASLFSQLPKQPSSASLQGSPTCTYTGTGDLQCDGACPYGEECVFVGGHIHLVPAVDGSLILAVNTKAYVIPMRLSAIRMKFATKIVFVWEKYLKNVYMMKMD